MTDLINSFQKNKKKQKKKMFHDLVEKWIKWKMRHTNCCRNYLSMCNWSVECVVARRRTSTSSYAEVSVGQDGRIVSSAGAWCDIASKVGWIGTADCAAATASAAQRPRAASTASTVRRPSCVLVRSQMIRLASVCINCNSTKFSINPKYSTWYYKDDKQKKHYVPLCIDLYCQL